MKRFRHTKIVATLGPASADSSVVERLLLTGVDVFRLNFSHGTHEDHKKNLNMLRALEKKHNRTLSILQDLQGPKLRIGTFSEGPISLKPGDTFRLTLKNAPGNEHQVCLPHPEIFQVLEPHSTLLLDDGKVRLKVTECTSDTADTIVEVGGTLSNRKGVNVPGVALPLSALTAKDKKDLAFGLSLGVDWVALSFVQKPEDLIEIKKIVGDRAAIISKLEKPKAIEHLDDIIDHSDGIMVARGDLGVELSPEEVPPLQREIIRKSRAMGRPVIVATQMLDSMVDHPTPTRAEASDVATAVYDGVDAVMLSAESASGRYPVEAVDMMSRIIDRVEQDPLYRSNLEASRTKPRSTPSDAITSAARQVAQTISASGIVTLTHSGSTTLRTAYERPVAPIVALTPTLLTARQLNLVWGTHPILVKEFSSIERMIQVTTEHMLQKSFGEKGESVVITAGTQFGLPKNKSLFQTGTTRVLRIVTLGQQEKEES